jgi:alkylation response protein AidB-like acyl-CoA dehydrogenase
VNLDESVSQRDARIAYLEFLEDFLPSDHRDNPDRYRHDAALAADYQRAAFERGWLMPHWETGLGGRGLGIMATLSVRLAAAERGAPQLPNVQGPNVVGPMLRQFGTTEQQERYLVRLLRGDDRWALGMSEPEAGSDFASLRTTATRSGDGFIVNGQKVWTSHAAESAYATVYCRTNADAGRHRGLSCLIVDLTAPGVTVRPIPMAAGSDDRFCEVFLDNVQVGPDALVGPLDGGWSVAMAALNEERSMIWVMNWADLQAALTHVNRSIDTGFCDNLLAAAGRSMADAAALRFTGLACAEAQDEGNDHPAALALKLIGSEALQRAWQLTLETIGTLGGPDLGRLNGALDSLGATIYGGTSEIQRGIIAERALGLPRG